MIYQRSRTCFIATRWLDANGEKGGGVDEGATPRRLGTSGAMASFIQSGFAAADLEAGELKEDIHGPQLQR